MVSSRTACIKMVCTVITVWIAETNPIIRCMYKCYPVSRRNLMITRSEVIVKCTG